MNNDTSTSGSQLSATGNPQNIGTQNLSAPKSDLQTTLSQTGNNTNFTITSVGDNTFTPFDAGTETESSLSSELSGTADLQSSTNFLAIGLVAGAALVICALAIWMMYKDSRKKLLER